MKKLSLWINVIGLIILSFIQWSCKKDNIANEFNYNDLDQYYIVGILDLDKNTKSLYSIYFTKEGNNLYANYVDRYSIGKVLAEQNKDTIRINIDKFKENTYNFILKKQSDKYILQFIDAAKGAYGIVKSGKSYIFRKDNTLAYNGITYESIEPLGTFVKLENSKWGSRWGDTNIQLNKNYLPINNYIWHGENYFGIIVPEWESINYPIMLMSGVDNVILKLKEKK